MICADADRCAALARGLERAVADATAAAAAAAAAQPSAALSASAATRWMKKPATATASGNETNAAAPIADAVSASVASSAADAPAAIKTATTATTATTPALLLQAPAVAAVGEDAAQHSNYAMFLSVLTGAAGIELVKHNRGGGCKRRTFHLDAATGVLSWQGSETIALAAVVRVQTDKTSPSA